MNETQHTPVLIAGFTSRLEAIRQEALGLIQNAVAEHTVIGRFYKNRGVHYRDTAAEGEEYDSSPIVVTHNSSFSTYGGYEAATVYELFADKNGCLLCTLNGEAGEDFDEPLEHIQTEGLLEIVRWLIEHGFVTDDPWRCEECGSIAVQEQIWVDTNTRAACSQAYNRDENYCCDCDENTYQIRESELLRNINRWWHNQDFRQRERLTGYRQDDFDPEEGYRAFADACDNWWNALSNEEKIAVWKDNQ